MMPSVIPQGRTRKQGGLRPDPRREAKSQPGKARSVLAQDGNRVLWLERAALKHVTVGAAQLQEAAALLLASVQAGERQLPKKGEASNFTVTLSAHVGLPTFVATGQLGAKTLIVYAPRLDKAGRPKLNHDGSPRYSRVVVTPLPRPDVSVHALANFGTQF